MEQYINEILNYVYNLDAADIKIIIGVTAFLVLFIAGRWFGYRMIVALCFIYLIAYILYTNNIVNIYEEREKNKAEHEELLQKELMKSNIQIKENNENSVRDAK